MSNGPDEFTGQGFWNDPNPAAHPNRGKRYQIGRRMNRPVDCAYEPAPGEPASRSLRIFAIDPAASKLEGKSTSVDVPYEPLLIGPVGRLLEVDSSDELEPTLARPVDLEAPEVWRTDGYPPSDRHRRFNAQMTYAVASLVHKSFRQALGRQIGWPFGPNHDIARLRIRPSAGVMENAEYDPNRGELLFGYFKASQNPSDRTLPRGIVYTSLSHDIICHEMAHAMLDAVRPGFVIPSNNDQGGFHEGFADLVALFHHFRHEKALKIAIEKGRGDLLQAPYLSSIGQQFKRASGSANPLRSAVAVSSNLHYDTSLASHGMGELLLSAVYEAFVMVFNRKVARLFKLARSEGLDPTRAELPDPLVDLLSSNAARLADSFLTLLIRALDYLPPVDMRLGDYLRALITCDFENSPDDALGWREALIDSFRSRQIYPFGVMNLDEESLLWLPPDICLPPIYRLRFSEQRFADHPGAPSSIGDRLSKACELGEYLSSCPSALSAFGLAATGDSVLGPDSVTLPTIESVYPLRRRGPNDEPVFDTVVEILQVRSVAPRPGHPGFELHGGATIVIDPDGAVRYAITRPLYDEERLERRRQYLNSPSAKPQWKVEGERYVPDPTARLLCLNTSTGNHSEVPGTEREPPSTLSMASEQPTELAGSEKPAKNSFETESQVAAESVTSFEAKRDEPRIRRLRVFVGNPTGTRFEGRTATAEVPFEPLSPGPDGRLISVDIDISAVGLSSSHLSPADLDDRQVWQRDGYDPADDDPRFAAQMLYAIASMTLHSFRRAFGRDVRWGVGSNNQDSKLRIRVRFAEHENAWFDPSDWTLNFEGASRPVPRAALSHDIVCHELVHGLMFGLHGHSVLDTDADQMGFHCGFSDLIALFQRYRYRDAVKNAIAAARGIIRRSTYLCEVAATAHEKGASVEEVKDPRAADSTYQKTATPDEHKKLLFSAVFDAFATVFEHKTMAVRQLAAGDTPERIERDLGANLVEQLASEASRLADQFLMMLIRSLDYLPPTRFGLGEFLRAMVTADRDRFAIDKWGFRRALVDSFRVRNILPPGFTAMSEDSLCWPAAPEVLPPVDGLRFSDLRFARLPSDPLPPEEERRRLAVLHHYATSDVNRLGWLNLVPPGDTGLGWLAQEPRIGSLRVLTRPGYDGHTVYDTVAEFVQSATQVDAKGQHPYEVYGGSTVHIDGRGHIRYVISRSLLDACREQLNT